MSIPESEWDAAREAIENAREVVLACHVGPDGDALGSMLALGLALRARRLDVFASWGEEQSVVPARYAFLPGQDLLHAPESLTAVPELMIVFDAGSLDRLGTLEPNARASKTLVVVDHHASNARFGTVNLVDPTAAASGILVYELLRRMGAEIDSAVATCLYTSILTDTGRFQYSNTTPGVHIVAADLLSRGVPHEEITRGIYETHALGFLHLAARALERATLHPRAPMVWTWVTQQDLALSAVSLEEIDSLIDLVRTAREADVAVVLKQQPDGRYRVSMRSKGAHDIGAVCEAFGGGGHALAAGFTTQNADRHFAVEQIARSLSGPSPA